MLHCKQQYIEIDSSPECKPQSDVMPQQLLNIDYGAASYDPQALLRRDNMAGVACRFGEMGGLPFRNALQ